MHLVGGAMSRLDLVQHLVVLMMENRSFDHVFGYLSLAPLNRDDVDGLQDAPAWQRQWPNADPDDPSVIYVPGQQIAGALGFDPPHLRESVATQLAPDTMGLTTMTGFVQAAMRAKPEVRAQVMAYQTDKTCPVFH